MAYSSEQANANASCDRAEQTEAAPSPRGGGRRGAATTTFRLLVAYLADGREGTANIPGETPGMG